MTKALKGYRVLDLSRLLPGPYCTMLLGDLGADVVKVEDVQTGDPSRFNQPRVGDQSIRFRQLNRNKRSIAIDLKSTKGRELFLKLAVTADLVLEQFRPGVVDRLGVGYDAVCRVNPGIVYCSLTGYGQSGPYRDRAGHDLNYVGLAGALGLTADDSGRPAIPGVQIADIAGGMMAAFSMLAALLARQRTGQGQYIDVSMFDVVLSMLPVPAANEFAGSSIGIGGRYILTGAYPFYNVYETGDGGFLTLGALEPKFWQNFCRAVGREDLIPRQFDEGERRDELFRVLREIFKSRTRNDWVAIMQTADCCCEPVLSMAESFSHAQTLARDLILQVMQKDGLELRQLGFGYKLSATPPAVDSPSPALGEHTDELLEELRVTPEEIAAMKTAGVVR
ncbi:MAG TPA: CaiB/BaiF CoA-transferase family protein [Blastocatellia bacterium]|nr:CaiB/BaiF CoA-transferase family protein [Blastocatellia bacterium]